MPARSTGNDCAKPINYYFMGKLKKCPQTQWHIIYTTPDAAEAHIIAGRLRASGITAILDRAPGMASIGITIGTLGETRVLVHPADYHAASSILSDDESNDTSSNLPLLSEPDDQ